MAYKILSIEDTSSFRRLIKMTLEFQGFEVIEADGGRIGLEFAKAQKADLILLDLMMPDISGLEVCKEIENDSHFRMIPVILLSSSDDSEEIENALLLGAQGYLLKPFRPQMLLEIIQKNLKVAGSLRGQVEF